MLSSPPDVFAEPPGQSDRSPGEQINRILHKPSGGVGIHISTVVMQVIIFIQWSTQYWEKAPEAVDDVEDFFQARLGSQINVLVIPWVR
jgi:hypothetical protein